jgi:hypothetical protein
MKWAVTAACLIVMLPELLTAQKGAQFYDSETAWKADLLRVQQHASHMRQFKILSLIAGGAGVAISGYSTKAAKVLVDGVNCSHLTGIPNCVNSPGHYEGRTSKPIMMTGISTGIGAIALWGYASNRLHNDRRKQQELEAIGHQKGWSLLLSPTKTAMSFQLLYAR